MRKRFSVIAAVAFCISSLCAIAAENSKPKSRVDPSTLTGKIMCGYQGWFGCPDDGMDLGWLHWSKKRRNDLGPGNVTVDLWPDMSELGSDERYATNFVHDDGRTAEVFSSANYQTVARHFRWMRDYGIDGAFLQRFANGLDNPDLLKQRNTVLEHVRRGSSRAFRAYAVMYDLSGLGAGEVVHVREDWESLHHHIDVTKDSTYLHHDGRPVVAVWGIGFGGEEEPRNYSLAECRALIEFLKSDGCTVMLGVPTGWRDLDRDSVSDPELHEILQLADIVSPWTVGRYRNVKGVARHAERHWKPDQAWCEERGMEYLPVVYPGFSWHNLTGESLGAIPRLKGEFLWSQMVAAKRAGAEMLYVAMFDEVDEGTAIFKCTNDPPSGDGVSFLTYEGLASDYYLRLTGAGGKMLQGEIPTTDALPKFKPETTPSH